MISHLTVKQVFVPLELLGVWARHNRDISAPRDDPMKTWNQPRSATVPRDTKRNCWTNSDRLSAAICSSGYESKGHRRCRPPPPVESKMKGVRYFHIHEDDELDEKLVTNWIRQVAKLPGEMCF